MIKLNQNGSVVTLLAIAILGVLLVVTLTFGIVSFKGEQNYKNNVDAKVAVAVTAAKQAEDTKQAAAYAETAKSPLHTYSGPEAYGSVNVSYPKTWSSYVDDTGTGGALLDGYFAPNTVPSLNGQSSVFSLRVQVLSQAYAVSVQNQTSGQQSTGAVVTPYSLPKVPSVVGVKVVGTLTNSKTGTLIILPLRDKTLEISTFGNQYVNDFNTYVLPNFTFSP